MNRNVTIVVIILVFVVIAGYLVWLRSKVQAPVSPKIQTEEVMTSPTSAPTVAPATDSAKMATQSAKEATGSMKEKGATGSSTKK